MYLNSYPKDWKQIKLRQILRPFSEKNHPELPLLSVVREKGVIVRNVHDKEENHNYVPEDLSNYKRVKRGQFAMNKMKAWQGSYGISKYDGIVSPAYFVFDVDDDINLDFFNVAIRSQVYVSYFGQASDGIRVGQWDLSMQRMKEISFLVPPRTEQDQIVRFLDWKVSAINRLIGIKRKDTVLLEEISKAVINKIITKGLHDVPLKNSCIKWIGNIPKHWDVVRCKFLFRERDERSASGSEEHLSMSQKFGLIPDDQLNERRMLSESYQGGKLCYRDDIVLNRLKAHLGVFALSQQLGVISPDYTVLMPNKNKILPSYAETILKSDLCRGELRMRVRGLVEGFWRLYTNDFYNIFLPIPPLDEQKVIMRYIHGFSNKIERYRKNIIVEIKKLEELKNRLIADTVTGKIDVRNIEIPNYEFVGEESQAEEEIAVEASENEE